MSKKLPSVTSDIPRDLRTFIDRLREIISGNGYDRLVTAQDLINGGIAGPGGNGSLVPPTTGVVQTPPAPANVSATGGVYSVFVEWDNPTYYGHDYAEVYSGATDVIGDAVLLGFTPGVNYVDTIGPSQSRYYWVRFVNTLGVKGPFNSVSGTLGTTTAEVQHLLNVLTGAITETQLYQDLGSRINLIDGPISLAGSVAARVYAEAQARLAADTTLGSSITSLQTSDSTQATQISTLQTRATNSESNIITLQNTTATQATTISSLTTRTSTAESNITNLQTTTASQASSISSLTTRTSTAESNITNLQTTTANQASSITTLSSSVGANTTAIQTEATTRASETGSLFSKYTVKIDTNGYVSGFGLASTANNATPFSDFIIRADRFSIASPTGPGITPVIPFVVTTTPTVINGVTVNPGVYINGAYIQGGSIQGASIAGGTIENTKLINVSANKITGAALEATSYIESAAYIAGSQGWKIHANGTAEFAAASIRGQLLASQIDTRNLTIKDSSGTVLFGAGTNLNYANITASSGWLNSNITLNSNGTLSGAGGGSVSLSGLGAGAFATLSQITQTNIGTYIQGAAIGTAYIANLAVKTALIDNLAVTNAKIDNLAVTSAKIDNLAVTSAKIGDAEVGTLKIAGNAVTIPVTATGAVGTTFSTGVSVSIKTSATTYPAGTTIIALFTALKTAFGAGDIEVILNCLTSSNTLVATFAGSSAGQLVQTMGPNGDKVTAIFTGTYTIPFDGSFKIEAIVSNPYGGSWMADYCTVIALGSKR